MSDVMIRGLIKVHNENRRSQNEQSRELDHLRHRAYRGVPVSGSVQGEPMHGTYVYRGRTYTK